MTETSPALRVEVSFVGAPPVRQLERASGVSEVETDGQVLRCLVSGSFQPFLEAPRGHEVISFTTAGRPRRPLAGAEDAVVGRLPDSEVRAMSALGLPRGARSRAQARGSAIPGTLAARAAGALFIAATVASLISTGLLNPVFSGSNYLLEIAAHQDRIVAGAFFQIVAAFASAGIAVSLYPVLRRRSEALALGSIGFRFLEGGLYLVAAIGTLLLVQVGQDATAGSPVPSYLQASGALLQALRDKASLIGVLAFYLDD
jgi:hypothetical protein